MNRIRTADVMAVLLPIWAEKQETVRRVRQRVSAVMRWAVAQGYQDDNPAGEAIGAALPKNGVQPRHHPALPYAEVGGANREGARVRGLSRDHPGLRGSGPHCVPESGEVRGARWAEISFDAQEWCIPADCMKAKLEHRVPLSTRPPAVFRLPPLHLILMPLPAIWHRRFIVVHPDSQSGTQAGIGEAFAMGAQNDKHALIVGILILLRGYRD